MSAIRTSRARTAALTACTAVLALATAGFATATTPTRPLVTQPAAKSMTVQAAAAASIAWGDCTNETLKELKAQCGTVSVPLDYSKPGGTKIQLAVSRVRHTVSAKKYQGVMLVNPGGPGGSGLVLSFLGQYVPKKAGAAYDWIGFDPRGVGASEPKVTCDPYYFGFSRPRYEPTTAKITAAWKRRTNAYTRACAARNGAILKHLTTRDSARDMDRIRRALGVKTINYYGFSYGTYLGQVYATLYPQRLRRVVFDGTVDPRGVWYGDNLDQDVAFDKNINIWFGWLARYDSVFHLGKSRSTVRKRYYGTQEALYRHPAGRISGSEWTDAFLPVGYSQQTWVDLGNVFSAYVNQRAVKPLDQAYRDAVGYGDDNSYAVYLGVQCTDTAWPQKWSTWTRDNWRVNAKSPFFTWPNAWFNEPCRHWPAPPHHLVKVTGTKVSSVLMISETLDAATPYPGSLEVRRRFPGARLIAEPGGTTHARSLGGNACVDNRIASYLQSGALPRRAKGNGPDVSCRPLPQPDPTKIKALQTPQGLPRPDLRQLLRQR